jgi:thiol-disulfide isomerase/thioredoxin
MRSFLSPKGRRVLVRSLIVLALLSAAAAIYFYFFYLPPESVDTFTGEYELALKSYDGNEVELSDFRRELLVVHAWASWCVYCGEELKSLVQLKERYGDAVTILAVNRAEPEVDAKAFTDALGLDASKIEILLDRDDAFYKSIEGYAMPETIFITARGEIIHHQRGPMRIDEVVEKIDALIGQ